jgi:hypothetical protein
MIKSTPEIEEKIKTSGKPVIRLTLEEFSQSTFISNEELRKKLLKKSTKK